MIIDLEHFIYNNELLEIDNNLEISNDLLIDSGIRKLDKIHFKGKLTKLIDNSYHLIGTLSGIIIVPDDITLEDYCHNFTTQIDEELDDNFIKGQKTLDITNVLWPNIIVEIPLKAVNEKNKNITLKGEGWSLISEEEMNTNNNPLSQLEELINVRKE